MSSEVIFSLFLRRLVLVDVPRVTPIQSASPLRSLSARGAEREGKKKILCASTETWALLFPLYFWFYFNRLTLLSFFFSLQFRKTLPTSLFRQRADGWTEMPGRKIRLTSGSSLIIIGTSLANTPTKTIKGKDERRNPISSFSADWSTGNSVSGSKSFIYLLQWICHWYARISLSLSLSTGSSTSRRHHHYHHSSKSTSTSTVGRCDAGKYQ